MALNSPKEHAQVIVDERITPFIRLMPRVDYKTGCLHPNPYSLANIAAGELDEDIIRWANAAKDFGHPLMVEFGTEVNGSWFPWSGACNGGDPRGPQRFRHAYRHIVRLFRRHRVNNVTWAFHVDAYGEPDAPWNRISEYYPGDSWVDWIGVSAYGAQTEDAYWQEFGDILLDVYPQLELLSYDKPIAVLEFGVHEPHAGGKKDEWIRKAFKTLNSGDYPRIKAISYWHENFRDEGKESRLRIDSSKSARAAYRSCVVSDVFLSDTITKTQ